MSENQINRREFLKTNAAAGFGLVLTASGIGTAKSKADAKSVRVGVVGTGNRGRYLLSILVKMDGIKVPALCDINVASLAAGQEIVVGAGQSKPEGYSKNEYVFQRLMEREDLDAVVIATPWDWHSSMAVYGMKAGKYVAVEVPAAVSLKQCRDLVNTSEETGVPCMMLENWSFRRDNLAVLNMIRKGLFGEIVHCHCAHSHDCVDHWFFDSVTGAKRWSAEHLLKYNRSLYPTHALGPVLSWMDINCGDRFDYLTATATRSLGINDHFIRKFGRNHPNAKLKYKQGDIVTTVVRTYKGNSIVINYDMQLPRPYDNRWMIQGTRGLYDEDQHSVYIVGKSPEYHKWEPFAPYQEEYEHAWWKTLGQRAEGGGHGGVDYIELALFAEAVRSKTQTPIDVYDSVIMSVIIPLSGQSIARGSAPVKVPDFTKGKWKTRKPVFALEV